MTRLYQEFYEPLGVNHQIAFTLPSGASRVLAVALSREDPDYSDAERDFLNRARPYLIQGYRNAIAYSKENRDIADHLEVSDRTVQKHLENAFRRLGVTSRSQAAGYAWELATSLELAASAEASVGQA